MGLLKKLDILQNFNNNRNSFSKVKLLLFFSFIMLILIQLYLGFNYLDDYLIGFIFILFLNDQFHKFKRADVGIGEGPKVETKNHRVIASAIILLIIIIPWIFEYWSVPLTKQFLFYKVGFILWTQIFLIDAFMHYKETNSKKWLIFANIAVVLTLVGAFIV